MSKRRVVITGLGTINPLSNNVSDSWEKLINGISGIDNITSFDTGDLPVTFAGEVKNFDANEYMGKQHARKLDRSGHLSIYAAEQALLDAGFSTEERMGTNCGIVFGTGIGGIGATEDAVRVYDERGASRINPLAITQLMPNSSTGQVAIKFGIEGPSLTITTACAASANAVGEAKNMIENGIVDIVVAGGTESGTTPMTIGAFAQIRALSTKNDTPAKACSPFDKNRKYYSNSITIDLPVATNNSLELVKLAVNGLTKIYKYGFFYQKAGIILSKLREASENDFNLLAPIMEKKSKTLMQAIDLTNAKYGRNAISIAQAGINNDWKMRREHSSRIDTASFDSLPKISI